MREDFYIVLGVARDASPGLIRRAFRELALRVHPDRAGPASKRRFQDALEAYRVLSDSERRAAYDAELVRSDRPPRRVHRESRAPAEPLIPDRRTRRGFAFEVLLSPAEAASGLTLELRPDLPGRLYLPPGVRDGDWFQVTLDAHGGRPVILRLHVRVVEP